MDEQVAEEPWGVLYRDILTLVLMHFVLFIMVLLQLDEPGKKAADAAPPPGNVIVEVSWPDEMATDVDLWVQGPGDVPVGYSNKGGKLFNLLRDDLGVQNDTSGQNYEVSYSRGLVSGEYIVNLHLYRNNPGKLPVPCVVTVSTKPSDNIGSKEILKTRVELKALGQELTVFRFKLDANGELVPGSVNALKRGLRTWQGGQ